PAVRAQAEHVDPGGADERCEIGIAQDRRPDRFDGKGADRLEAGAELAGARDVPRRRGTPVHLGYDAAAHVAQPGENQKLADLDLHAVPPAARVGRSTLPAMRKHRVSAPPGAADRKSTRLNS